MKKHIIALIIFGILFYLALITYTRAEIWKSAQSLQAFQAEYHPGSYRTIMGEAMRKIASDTDLIGAFGDFQKAAIEKQNTIIPLVEMGKVAQSFVLTQPHTWTDPIELSADALLHDEPEVSGAYMAGVLRAVDKEVRRRLADYPIHAESMYAMSRLAECIAKKHAICLPFGAVLVDWLDIALKNGRYSPTVAGMLNIERAQAYTDANEPELALERVRDAVKSDPSALGYRYILANLLMDGAHWSEASDAITGFQDHLGWFGWGDKYLDNLKKRFEKTAPMSGLNFYSYRAKHCPLRMVTCTADTLWKGPCDCEESD